MSTEPAGGSSEKPIPSEPIPSDRTPSEPVVSEPVLSDDPTLSGPPPTPEIPSMPEIPPMPELPPTPAARPPFPGVRSGLRGGPAVWLAGGAFLVALVALIVAVSGGGGGDDGQKVLGAVGATGPVGPTIGVSSEPPTDPAQLPVEPSSQAPTESQSSEPPVDTPVLPPPSSVGSAECPTATTVVQDAVSLTQALAGAKPGAVIQLADGTYSGQFVAGTAGTEKQPITLCGGPGAVLDGGGIKKGYTLHLDGANWWRVLGFTVRSGEKGVMADKVQHTLIQHLTVEQVGDEAIHLRNFSSDNTVADNTVRSTGLRKPGYGEGIYIGSAQSNWCAISGCKPDNSDHNIIRGNTISGTTGESIDIKEGTSDGSVLDNTFDGSAIKGDNHADSWVDVKGNGWQITGNTGRHSIEDGFQIHQQLNGWGTGNVFKGNTAEVNGPGYGFNSSNADGNTISCDNKAVGAAKGLSNKPCS